MMVYENNEIVLKFTEMRLKIARFLTQWEKFNKKKTHILEHAKNSRKSTQWDLC